MVGFLRPPTIRGQLLVLDGYPDTPTERQTSLGVECWTTQKIFGSRQATVGHRSSCLALVCFGFVEHTKLTIHRLFRLRDVQYRIVLYFTVAPTMETCHAFPTAGLF